MQSKAIKISESILYERAVERQQSEERLRVAANKLTAHITRPGSPSFRQQYDQTAFGTRRGWSVKDMIDLAIEANAPDEDILAFPQQLLAETEQALAERDKRREGIASVSAALTVETIEGAKQDIAAAQFLADPTPTAAQKLFDRTVRLERAEGKLAGACRRVLLARGFARLTTNTGTKQW